MELATFVGLPCYSLSLSGRRRYLLAPPMEHHRFQLYPDGHPSERHSRVDLSRPEALPDLTGNSTVLEIELSQGDVLFVPAKWIHYIISLTPSVQCAIRS